MSKPLFALALYAILTAPAVARMYQWTQPETGTVQMSGHPPAWYRAAAGGPRVLVFDNGELVDDTAITVPDAQRLVLRETAFAALGEEPAAEAATDPAAASRDALEAAMEKAHDLGLDVEAVADEFSETRAAAAASDSGADAADDLAARVAELKALIDAFDQRQSDRARAVLGLEAPAE